MENNKILKDDTKQEIFFDRKKSGISIVAEKIYYYITMYLVYLIYLLPAAYTAVKCRRHIVDYEELKSIFEGKTVAIVGPAETVNRYQNGKLIDSCDLVVRLNYGYSFLDPTDKDKSSKLGTKTSVIFTYFHFSEHYPPILDAAKFKEQGVSHVISILRDRRARARRHRGIRTYYRNNTEILKDKLSIISKKSYSRFWDDLGSKPTIGHIGIRTVLDSNPASVFVTGITFQTTHYIPGYISGLLNEEKSLEELHKGFYKDSTSHKPDRELHYFISLLKKTSAEVKLDPFLEELVKKNTNS